MPTKGHRLGAPRSRPAIRDFLACPERVPSLSDLGIPREMVEAAEEIVDSSDVLGIETDKLEFLIRFLIAMDRDLFQRRSPKGR